MVDYARVHEISIGSRPAALVTVVETMGSTPRALGARMIVFLEGETEGTIGGGKLELVAVESAKEAIRKGEHRTIEHHLTQDLAMCCGGTVKLYIEVLQHPSPLVIFGAGHVGQALARAAELAGFQVTVVDSREEFLIPDRFSLRTLLFDDYRDQRLAITDRSLLMVTTHDHAMDQTLVEYLLRRPFRWLGLIGSARKAIVTRKRLIQKGFTKAETDLLRCPVGLAIGAETPEEIAVSIVAELIAVVRGVDFEAGSANQAERIVGARAKATLETKQRA